MMRGSKIASTATYHKCIKDLQRLGYLEYKPSFNPYVGTSITINNLQEGSKLKFDEAETGYSKKEEHQKRTESKIKQANAENSLKNELGSKQAGKQVDDQLYIDSKKTFKNYSNIINIDREPESNILENDFDLESKKEKSAAKNEKVKNVISSRSSKSVQIEENPSLELVKEYFKFQENTVFEAERFFNYYSSNGWLIGGKSEMKDWKAAARNWMLNTSKFAMKTPQKTSGYATPRADNLHAETDKDYAEPL